MLKSLCLYLLAGIAVKVYAIRGFQQLPDGYILALKNVEFHEGHQHHDEVTLFNITLDGQVEKLWNITLMGNQLVYDVSTFAVNTHDNLVYLPCVHQFLAVDLHTGKSVIEFSLESPNLQYFTAYDYNSKDMSIYGICASNNHWGWCSMKQTGNSAKLKYHFQLPEIDNSYGPVEYVYDVDIDNDMIWYYSSFANPFLVGVDSTSGNTIFRSGPSGRATCVCHDATLNRTFAIVQNVIYESIHLTEIQAQPASEKVLLELPQGELRVNFFGTCVYDQKTHTMIGVMGIMNGAENWYHGMPYALYLIDVVNLQYKSVLLPTFREQYESGESITGVKFINQ